jgi:dipeptidyl-peptidase-4
MFDRKCLLFVLLLLLAPLVAQADSPEPLTLERIFDSPALSGSNLRQVKLSPAGDRVTFTQGQVDDKNRMDLWEYHIEDQTMRLLVAADDVMPDEGPLSDEEKARRERARISALTGIVEYDYSADGRFLVFPLGGNVYVVDLDRSPLMVEAVTDDDAFDTDPKISPDGHHVAFIRNQNLWVTHLDDKIPQPLTTDGGGAIKNGMAEFIAQEEMGRQTGYWWSPNSDAIAFLRVDESPIKVTKRYEVQADTIQMVDQRYPYAGTANVTYQLGIVSMPSEPGEGHDTQWVDLGAETDIYIPRVDWLPSGRSLSYQRQSRDQKTLELIQYDLQTQQQKTLVVEQASTWVNLHDDLHYLSDGSGLIWSSERNGHNHLYFYDFESEQLQALTQGPWAVDRLEGVDETLGLVYFTAAYPDPTEKQLLRTSLVTQAPDVVSQVSIKAGWHEVVMDQHARFYIDQYSSTTQPPQLALHRSDGERLAWLNENKVSPDHPYWPYASAHQRGEFGALLGPEAQRLHYRMTTPPDFDAEDQYPVFVHVYGGPTSRLATNQWSRRALIDQYMAQQGYIVFSLDNRGIVRQGKAFQDAAYQRLGQIEMVDQMVGVDWLRSQPFVDPNRLGIFGWSYGGYLALMAASQYPGDFAASVAVAPVTDWSLYDTHYTERYLGNPRESPEVYDKANVLTYADQIDDPLLLIHGMADDNVLFTHSTVLMQRLQDQAIEFDLMTYPGEKHAISGEGQRLHVYQKIARFFDQHLTPD